MQFPDLAKDKSFVVQTSFPNPNPPKRFGLVISSQFICVHFLNISLVSPEKVMFIVNFLMSVSWNEERFHVMVRDI